MTGKLMKNLILLFLLTLPFSVHSQITFNDLKKLDSKRAFERICIEQGFEKNVKASSIRPSMASSETYYVLNPDATFEYGEIFAEYVDYSKYDPAGNVFYFWFEIDDGYGGVGLHYNTYQNITSDIKRSCTFYDVILGVAYYSCPGSLYPGKIGFGIKDGFGYIRNFDF